MSVEEVGIEKGVAVADEGGDNWKPKKRMCDNKVIPEPLTHFDPPNIDDVDGTLCRVQGRVFNIVADYLHRPTPPLSIWPAKNPLDVGGQFLFFAFAQTLFPAFVFSYRILYPASF